MRSTRASIRVEGFRMKTIRFSHTKINSFFILRCSAPFICHMSESDSSCAAAGTLVLVTRDARNNTRTISTILSRGSREIESRKKFRGRSPKERVKKCASARSTSVALHSGEHREYERFRYTTTYIYFFFSALSLSFSFSTITESIGTPFLRDERGKGMFYDVPRRTYTHP